MYICVYTLYYSAYQSTGVRVIFVNLFEKNARVLLCWVSFLSGDVSNVACSICARTVIYLSF